MAVRVAGGGVQACLNEVVETSTPEGARVGCDPLAGRRVVARASSLTRLAIRLIACLTHSRSRVRARDTVNVTVTVAMDRRIT